MPEPVTHIEGDFTNYLAHSARGVVPFSDLNTSVEELIRLAELGLAQLMEVKGREGFVLTHLTLTREDGKWAARFVASDLPAPSLRGWFTTDG